MDGYDAIRRYHSFDVSTSQNFSSSHMRLPKIGQCFNIEHNHWIYKKNNVFLLELSTITIRTAL